MDEGHEDLREIWTTIHAMKVAGFSCEIQWMNRVCGGDWCVEFDREDKYTSNPNNQWDKGSAHSPSLLLAVRAAADEASMLRDCHNIVTDTSNRTVWKP